MTRITLSEDDLSKAKIMANGWNTTTGKYDIKWKQNNEKVYEDTLNGIKYEIAVAKHFSIPYDGDIGQPGKLDVGGKYEVRGTKYMKGNLILHPEDKNAPYILVVGEGNQFDIIGWIMGDDGKKPEYWKEDIRHPCYFVPQSDLKDIDLLN